MTEQAPTAEARADTALVQNATRMAIAFTRADKEDAHDHNIEGWFEELEYSCQDYLQALADKGDTLFLTDVEESARDTAAMYSLALGAQAHHELLADLYRAAGVEQYLVTMVQERMEQQYPQQMALVAGAERIEDIGKVSGNGLFQLFEEPLKVSSTKLVESLTAAGITLPVLGADGLYDDEREDADEGDDD